MNILFINSFDCSATASGGVNRVVYILSRRFMEDFGYGCFLGYFEPQPAVCEPAPFDGRIHLNARLDEKSFEAFVTGNAIDVIQVNFLKKKNLPSLEAMYRIARRHGIKLLYCLHVAPGFELVTYSTWDRVKFSFRFHEHPFKELYRWLVTLSKPLLGRLLYPLIRKKYLLPYQNCDRVVLLSKHYAKDYAAIIGTKDLSKFSAIGNALTFKDFATEADIRSKRKEVLVVARLDEFSKRISLMLKMWKEIEARPQLNDWTLTVVGDGEAMNYYRYLEKKLGLQRVTFTGHGQPQAYYRRASVFLMTSSAEGWPMVLMEALPMGLATVAFDSFGALLDIIDNGQSGLLVPNNDRKAFIETLSTLMLDDEARVRLGKNAVAKSHEFEIDPIISRWRALYSKLLPASSAQTL